MDELVSVASALVLLSLACDRPPPEPPSSPDDSSEVAAVEPVAEQPPEPEPEPTAPSVAEADTQSDESPVAHANVSMSSIEVDGMTIRDFECRIEGGGGLFGAMSLFATLSENKANFDACAPEGAEPGVHWRFAGSRTEVLAVEHPSQQVAACVREVMAEVPPTMAAECHAILVLGG